MKVTMLKYFWIVCIICLIPQVSYGATIKEDSKNTDRLDRLSLIIDELDKDIRELKRSRNKIEYEIKRNIRDMNDRDKLLKDYLGPDYISLKRSERRIKERDRNLDRLKKLFDQAGQERDLRKLFNRMEEIERISNNL